MKKLPFLFIILLLVIGIASFTKSKTTTMTTSSTPKSIYDFKIASIDGGTIDFSQYKGKYILIVNTASKCGFTPQYKGLEQLYRDHGDKLVIVGFPSDNFADQEFHDNKDIKSF